MNIVVLGMHRSGTSLVMNLLSSLGYHVGHSDELTGSNDQNPNGFFERKDIRQASDALLHENFFDWYKVAYLQDEIFSKKSVSKYQDVMSHILDRLSTHDSFAFKEPRLCLTHKFIQKHIEDAVKLIVYRDPLAVARSLWRRNKIPTGFALLLWEKYYTQLLSNISSTDKVYVINYDRLIADPEVEVNQVADFLLSLDSLKNPLQENLQLAISTVDQSLNRNSSDAHSGEYLSQYQLAILDCLDQYSFNNISSLSENPLLDTQLYENQLVYENAKRFTDSYEPIYSDYLEMQQSLSWELGKPFRTLADWFPNISNQISKAIRASVQLIKYPVRRLFTSSSENHWQPSETQTSEIDNYLANRRPNNTIAIVTAIYGGYDLLTLPESLETDIDYICFTDGSINNFGVWNVLSSPYFDPNPTKMARFVKTHMTDLLPDYSIYIWIDANIIIRGDIKKYLNYFIRSQTDVAFIKHPIRNSIFKELEACKARGKADSEAMDQQVKHYQDAGISTQAGLFETNLFMCRNTDMTRQLFRHWWNQIDQHTIRDQLSLPWVLESQGINFSLLTPYGVSVRNNPDFSLYHHHEIRKFNYPASLKAYYTRTSPSFVARSNEDLKGSVDVIITVFNALEDVKRCLESVVKYRDNNLRIIIVNDASDAATTDYLRTFVRENEGVNLIENEQNLGYVQTANRGMQSSDAELCVLLNSDTIVTSNWHNKLYNAAYSSKRIGIVGPLSNAASYQSIPDIKGSHGQTAINELPVNISIDELNAFCESQHSKRLYPRFPLVHGFAIAIKKEVFQQIGYFDQQNFEKYYGEENDFCFRARKAGFELAIAMDTFIYHCKSRSIEESERLIHMSAAGKKLREIYGADSINLACKQMAEHPMLVEMREQTRRLFNTHE